MAIAMCGPFLQVVFTIYLYLKAKKFTKGHCPHKKMSSIGKYKRNLMSHGETTMMAIMWNLMGVWETSNHYQYKNSEISPGTAFQAENLLWLIFGEGTIFLFTIGLSLRDIPTIQQIPRRTKFYLHKPNALEPRQPTSLHGDIKGPPTVRVQIHMKEFSNSPNSDSLCVVKNTHSKVSKLPHITSVKTCQFCDEMKRVDEILSFEGAGIVPEK